MLTNCINKKKSKSILLILCLFLLFLLTGCASRKTADESNSQITLSPTTKASGDKSEPTEALTEPTEVEPSEAAEPKNAAEPTKAIGDFDKTHEEPKIEDFSKTDEYIKDYAFDISYTEKLELYQRTYSAHGEYDLNGDGKADKIEAVLKTDYEDGSFVEVNGIKATLNHGNPSGEIQIIDLDNRDSYTEVAIYDNGPSDDLTIEFFRYDGKELNFIGSVDRGALMDGQGKFISGFHLSNNIKPQFFSQWGEFVNNGFSITNHDVEQYIGKTYEVDGTGFFIPLDKNPENYFDHTVWDFEAQREFKATKIKLLDIHNINPIDRTLNWYYVELPDGDRGLLYFWIGD